MDMECSKMKEAYGYLFKIENAIRGYIEYKLEKEYGVHGFRQPRERCLNVRRVNHLTVFYFMSTLVCTFALTKYFMNFPKNFSLILHPYILSEIRLPIVTP